jgi:hypothetical protein
MDVVSVFYSTTEDLSAAKYKPIFEEVALQVGRILKVHFDVLYWRAMPGGLGGSAQAVIDERVRDKYEVYFGIMGFQFGRGTEHEYRLAVESHVKTGKPIFACFGFCEEPTDPHALDIKSFAKVAKFRKDIGTSDKYGKAILYFGFTSEQEFRQRVEAHLTQAANEIMGRVAGGKTYGV